MKKLITIAAGIVVLGAGVYTEPAHAQEAPRQSAASAQRQNRDLTPGSSPDPQRNHGANSQLPMGVTFKGPLSRGSGMTPAHQRALARNGGVDRYKGALIWNDGRGMSTRGLGLSSGWERHVWRQNRKMAYANDNCRYPTYQGHGCQTLNGKPIGPTNELRYLEF